MALSCNPKLLIADEPTTALDVTIQAQILDLMRELRRELGTAIMMITHDLGVIAELVEKVVVMYTGRIVESADTYTIFKNPKHPYTIGLLASIPAWTATAPGCRPFQAPCLHLGTSHGLRFPSRCAFSGALRAANAALL